MKNNYLIFFLVTTLGLFTAQAQIENFEALPDDANSFTNNSQPFETVGDFEVQAMFAGTGASGSNKYLDNDDTPGIGTIYSIKTTDNALFTAKDVDIFLSIDSGITVGGSGGVIIRGKQGASTIFTVVKNSGIPTGFAPDNGFFNVNFTTEGGVDNSVTNINVLEFELTGSFNYIAVDEFSFGPESIAADTNPPLVQTINLAGTPATTANSIDFTVTFNENANNVSLDDFTLDTSGSAVGTISSISGSGPVYTITVNGISGEGTLSIDLLSATDIIDDIGNGNGTNGNTLAFTPGDNHTVSVCFEESFENFTVSASSFTSNGLPFLTTNGLDVFNLSNSGASSSNQYLENNGSGSGSFSLTTSGGELFTMNTIDLYLSSFANGSSPTNDGTLIINGKVANSTVYSITKNTGFPTSLANGDNGFFNLNFATDGASDYTTVNVDEIEIIIGSSFVYLAVDHFEFCEQGLVDTFAPEVESISVESDPISIAQTVSFLVNFNENVINVTSDDFALATTGTATGSITGVTGSNSTYTVTVETIDGEGTIGVNLNAGTDIEDALGNSGVLAFTGALHTVSDCIVETFESFTDTDVSFTSNGILFDITNTLAVKEQSGAGTSSSDFFLENGTKGLGTYTINSTNGTFFTANTMQLYVSSDAAGLLPTNDGTLQLRGINEGSTVFTIDLDSGNTTFPTSLGEGNNGFFLVDFATDGAADYSGIDIDQIEIELLTTLVYLAVDDFGFCLDTTSPTVTITSSVTSPTTTNPIPVTITFSESVAAFDMGDLIITNGTIDSFSGTGDTYTFNIIPVTTGTITVDISGGAAVDASGNGNIAATQFIIEYDITLSNVDEVLEKGLAIFPNPASEVINISNRTNIDITGLQLIDVQGRLIRSQEVNSNDAIQVMKISEINSGIYFIKISTKNTSTVKRVVIR